MRKVCLMIAAAALPALGVPAAGAGPLEIPPELVARGGDHFGVAKLVRAAEGGNARAQTRLGFMHETGRGVPQDYVVAAMWYRDAAEQGEPGAQHLLGLLYDKGFGVPLDLIEALKWVNLAAGRAPARYRDYY